MPLVEHGQSLLMALRHRRSNSKDGPEETVAFCCVVSLLASLQYPVLSECQHPTQNAWWAGRESNPDLQLRTLPCCSVTLPTLWNSRRESNPDLFVRTEASSCLRPREPD